jgi:hypothetical protein
VQQRHQYNPNQPRVPKGHSTGGQWTDGAQGQGTISGEDDRLGGDYGQDTILQKGGGTEGDDAQETLVQEASLAKRLLAPLLRLPPAIPPALRTLEAGLQEYARLSALNNRDSQAIVEFRATEYERAGPSALQFVAARALTRSEVNEICKKLEKVQSLTNDAVKEVQARPLRMTPAVFGTFVHTSLRDKINSGESTNGKPDPNFEAEVSLLKTYDETGVKILERDRKEYERAYGKKGSIRLDVVENVGNGTVCVYDLKTGHSILNARRMLEIAGRVFQNEKKYGPIERIIVMEIKSLFGL